MITQSKLKEMFHYNRATGEFTRIIQTSSNAKKGDIVGTIDGKGYLHVSISKRFYRLHRLAFLYVDGVMPRYVDHKDRDRTNNRWSNLRAIGSCRWNAGNSGVQKNNTSGYRGVSFRKTSGKWISQIKMHGKQTYLGQFNTAEEAAIRYNEAAKEHFGEYATLNATTAT